MQLDCMLAALRAVRCEYVCRRYSLACSHAHASTHMHITCCAVSVLCAIVSQYRHIVLMVLLLLLLGWVLITASEHAEQLDAAIAFEDY